MNVSNRSSTWERLNDKQDNGAKGKGMAIGMYKNNDHERLGKWEENLKLSSTVSL